MSRPARTSSPVRCDRVAAWRGSRASASAHHTSIAVVPGFIDVVHGCRFTVPFLLCDRGFRFSAPGIAENFPLSARMTPRAPGDVGDADRGRFCLETADDGGRLNMGCSRSTNANLPSPAAKCVEMS